MTVKRTFPAIPNDIREWTRYLQGLFFARSFTATLGGVDAQVTGTIRYTVSAGIVCMSIPQILGTSDQTFGLLTSLPDEVTPQREQVCLARIVDNGTTAVGLVHIGTDTGITLYPDLDQGLFTASGSKGIKACCITYPLD